MQEVDVLVVGGGPAGLSASRAAARSGASVICVERKPKIGTDVRCAEGIGLAFLEALPFKMPENILQWHVNGIVFWNGNEPLKRTGGLWEGCVIDRQKLEIWLGQQATASGAKIWTDAQLQKLKLEGEEVSAATVNWKGKEITVKPGKVIAADGVNSTVLQEMGHYEKRPLSLAKVTSWEMTGLTLEWPRFEQVLIDDLALGGYGYIFPKSPTRANVGVGSCVLDEVDALFEQFVELPFIKKQVKQGRRVKNKSKEAPFLGVSEKWAFGNVLLAGDSANQNLKPFIEGIIPGIIAGDIAGELAASEPEVKEQEYRKRVEAAVPGWKESQQLTGAIKTLFAKRAPSKQFLQLVLAAGE